MLANIIIMVLILGYCAFVIYKSVKNSKEGKHMGMQPDAVEIVAAVADAAGLLLRELHSLLTKRII